MTGSNIKLLIVDDSKLTRVGLKTTFKVMNNIDVVGEAENGEIGIIQTKALKPDIILMDIGMPIMDGIKATRKIKSEVKDVKVIMLTSHESEQDVFDALSAGANSYCMKDIEPELLETVIISTHNGASWLDPRIAQIVLQNFSKVSLDSENSKEDAILTGREIEVLRLIARGYSNTEISKTLCISLNTVKTHIRNIFQKLEVEDRTQAAIKGMKQDLIQKENL